MFPVKNAKAGFFDSLKKIFIGEEIESLETSSAAISLPLLGSQNTLSSGMGGPVNSSPDTSLAITQDSALVASRNPAGILPPPEVGQITVYTVVAGDTPGSIADRFGISLNTLLWANEIRNARSIKIGDSLVILPVSGVRHEVKKGETVGSIAKKFKPRNEEDFDSFVNDILSYNGLSMDEDLETGREIIIPEGEVNIPSSPARPKGIISRFANLPEFIGYYLRPIFGGRKSQGIHGYNGIDLANSCGTPVLATAPGQVIISKSSGWNTGYGKYAAISHANNTQSLYGHMSKVFIQAGQSVNQGEAIGLVGSTGRSTGCHLHFEIRGARNPF
ncbi:MAG: peptidoglycan DD-metalloendopeptidase family protein [bacterium]|nr:peptidoglycan DD-metalloendopeptidase family protein [bacterium]